MISPMNAIDVISKILSNSLAFADFRYCLVDAAKHPFKINGEMARPNRYEDFVPLEDLVDCPNLDEYRSLGVSVQASRVCGVDLDHCVFVPFDYSTVSQYAKDVIEMFKDWAYIEFSFSGTGIRIFYRQPNIPEYAKFYYIHNSRIQTEYYQPGDDEISNRYLTVTGEAIYDNPVDSGENHMETIYAFLNKYMRRRPVAWETDTATTECSDPRSVEQLVKNAKLLMLSDGVFGDLWFQPAPGSGKDESERDFRLLKKICEKVTKDSEKARLVFECSDFFKSKDFKHRMKWEGKEHRYFKLMWKNLARR